MKQHVCFFNAQFQILQSFDAIFNIIQPIQAQFDTKIIVQTHSDVDLYNGDYFVIPKIEQQELATSNKFLSQDIHIAQIPYYEVSNSANGNTVIIGGDLNA